MKRGFTLIEMLVVIGIIAVLAGATLVSFSKMTKGAEKAKAQELVSEVATALTAIYNDDGAWPKALRDAANTDHLLDKEAALILGKRGFMSLSMDKDKTKLVGVDRFGLVTPWAAEVIKRKGTAASIDSPVPGGGTIQSHTLKFALDLDGDGIVRDVEVDNTKVNIRATAAVWCVSKDGKSTVQSWSQGQTKGIQ